MAFRDPIQKKRVDALKARGEYVSSTQRDSILESGRSSKGSLRFVKRVSSLFRKSGKKQN